MRDNEITMADVLNVLNVPYSANRASVNIPCPICDGPGGFSRRTQKRLNVNIGKGVFRCAKCGTSGRSLGLYAFLTEGRDPRNMSSEDFVEIANKIQGGNGFNKMKFQTKKQDEFVPVDTEAANVEKRSIGYSAFMQKLSLSKDHYNDLIRRGLRRVDIINNGYRSTPTFNGNKIAESLRRQGVDLYGVPGFFRDDNGFWRLVSQQSGYFIPVRDLSGKLLRGKGFVQGLQIRCDDPQGSKYMWLSSRDYKDGSGAKTWTHFCGYPEDEVIITEGPLKADIIYRFINKPVLAMPGVNAVEHLIPVLNKLRALGVKKIKIAFDMDMYSNKHVKQALENLKNIIESIGFEYTVLSWDTKYKGYDDYLLHQYLEAGNQLDGFLE